MPRLIGEAHARSLIYSGKPLDAREARNIDLVNPVALAEEVLVVVQELARTNVVCLAVTLRPVKSVLDGVGYRRAGCQAGRHECHRLAISVGCGRRIGGGFLGETATEILIKPGSVGVESVQATLAPVKVFLMGGVPARYSPT